VPVRGGILDMRGAVLAPGGATLRIQALNGGVQILIPASWRLETKVIGLGGVADARPRIDRPADAPTLLIQGWAIFGGFGIASEGPRARDYRAFDPQPIAAN